MNEQQTRLAAHLLTYICPDCGYAPHADGTCMCETYNAESDLESLDAAENPWMRQN